MRPQWEVIAQGPVSLGSGKLFPQLHARVAVPGQVTAAAHASWEPPWAASGEPTSQHCVFVWVSSMGYNVDLLEETGY